MNQPVQNKSTKLFVLDTNVILHDASCINQFEENDVVIPISVLEELDNFKRGNEQVHYNAREFLRLLDDFSENHVNGEEQKIDDGHQGTIRVVVNHQYHPDVEASFHEDKMDHRILNCAYKLSKENPDRKVVLVTKDTNLRLKARSLGLKADNYLTDQVQNVEIISKGIHLMEDVPETVIDTLYEKNECDFETIDSMDSPNPNENFILRNGQKSALAIFNSQDKKLKRVDKIPAYGITPRNAEQSFAMKILTDDSIQLVSLVGKAGTGKTLLALAAALECRQGYRQIYLARPIVPLSNRDLGFLPGDIQSKLDPYMQPLFDNLSVIRHQFKYEDDRAKRINDMMEQEKLLITPLAYIRGRSLQKVYFIVDEAQNLTPHEVKTIITRAGEGTKIIFTGDIHQIDHPYLDVKSNGISHLIARMKGQEVFAHITLEKGERSGLAELATNLL